ncbi:hypothetical protein M427DRAFT_424419 [Gonapodya prolifera JEL478]|uniref:Uncharacterized protein n=1 Tax=Gonapodya prolifera (strain JEL478) TaxID=1344416 RepID=A0A139A470_GONPJ|nr:hypothetical protein M427DRAFT_424419 [Gonapodya prolifera JEL478]|eukprot:KXS11591.1 hypothetical protein M427DRAFT_424419 [Gonapodya prolifera JEL478]
MTDLRSQMLTDLNYYVNNKLPRLNKNHLQEVLSRLGGKRSGNKADLILRIKTILEGLAQSETYTQFRKGLQCIDEAEGAKIRPAPYPQPSIAVANHPTSAPARITVHMRGPGAGNPETSFPTATIKSFSSATPPVLKVPVNTSTSYTPTFASVSLRVPVTRIKPRWSPYFEDEQMLSAIARSESFTVKLQWTLDIESSRKMMLKPTTSSPPPGSIKSPQATESYRLLFLMATETVAAATQTTNEGLSAEYPPYPSLTVNGSGVNQRFAGLKNKPHTAYPADITDFCYHRPGVHNTLEFRYQNSAKSYVGCVYMAKKLTVQQAVEKIKASNFKTAEEVKKERLNVKTDEDDLEVGIELLTLKDPVSKTRITVPMKASTCKHLQCFDGETFLIMNERSPNWTCPVCHRPFEAKNLMVDGWFVEVLEGLNALPEGSRVEQVEVDPGTLDWKVPTEIDMDVLSDDDDDGVTEKTRPQFEEIVLLDSDSEDSPVRLGSVDSGADPPARQARPRNTPRPRRENDIIDLTLDSDSEDDNAESSSRPSNPPAVPPLSIVLRGTFSTNPQYPPHPTGLLTPTNTGSRETSSASTDASRGSSFPPPEVHTMNGIRDAEASQNHSLRGQAEPGPGRPGPGRTGPMTTASPLASAAPAGSAMLVGAPHLQARVSSSPYIGYPLPSVTGSPDQAISQAPRSPATCHQLQHPFPSKIPVTNSPTLRVWTTQLF